jgi:hypothetical protein
MPVQSEADIETAVLGFARQPGGGLVLIPDSFTNEHRASIIAAVARNRLSSIERPFRCA